MDSEYNVIKNMLAIKKGTSKEIEKQDFQDYFMRVWMASKGAEFVTYPNELGAALVKRILYMAGMEMSKNPIKGYEPLQKLSRAAGTAEESSDTTTEGYVTQSSTPTSRGNVSQNARAASELQQEISLAPLLVTEPQQPERSADRSLNSDDLGMNTSSQGVAATSNRSRQATPSASKITSSSLRPEDVNTGKAESLQATLEMFKNEKACDLPSLNVTQQKVFGTLKVDVADELIDYLEEFYGGVKPFIRSTGRSGAATVKDKTTGLNNWRKHFLTTT